MDLSAFRNVVAQLSEGPGVWVFRGQSSQAWMLITSYERFYRRSFGSAVPFELGCFRSMLARFMRSASALTGKSYGTLSLFQKMAMAQHYGIPTPLLDWSHSPYIATYFAVSDTPSAMKDKLAFRIYAADVSQLVNNEPSPNEEQQLFEAGGPQFRFIDTESFSVRRIARQAGCFTFQNFDGCLYEWSQKTRDGINLTLKRYEVEGGRRDILRELELMGIRGGTLFDDLDYVARDVVEAELASFARMGSVR